MGLYYNPPHTQTPYPFIGGQQPLVPSKIAAIRPIVNNPPTHGGIDKKLLAILEWHQDFKPPPLAYFGWEQPLTNPPRSPSLPIVNNPPIVGGGYEQSPLAALLWYPDYKTPPPTYMGSQQPFDDRFALPAELFQAAVVAYEPTQLWSVLPAWWNVPSPNFQKPLQLTPPRGNLDIFTGPKTTPQAVPIDWIPPPPNPYFNWFQQLDQIPPPQPVVNNPPTTGGIVSQAILNSWLPPPPVYIGNDQPYQQVYTTPPSNLDVFGGGPKVPVAVINAWNIQAPQIQPQEFYPQQPVIISNPPTTGGLVSQAILNSWLPPPPVWFNNEQPYQAINLTPPQGNLDVFPGPTTVSQSVLNAWIPPPPNPYFDWSQPLQQIPAPKPVVNNPPTTGGIVSQAILTSWIPGPPVWFNNEQPYQVINLTPPQPSLDVFGGGPKVPVAVINAWNIQAPQIQPQEFYPQQPVVTYVPPLGSYVANLWYVQASQIQPQELLSPPSNLDVFGGGPKVPVAVINAWNIQAPQIQPQEFYPQQPIVTYVPPPVSYTILSSWRAQAPQIQPQELLSPPSNLDVFGGGPKVPVANLWYVQAPQPNQAVNLTPPQPSLDVFGGGPKVPVANLWYVQAPQIQLEEFYPQQPVVVVTYVPPPVSYAVFNSWNVANPNPYFDWSQPLQQIPAPKPVVNNPPFVGGARLPKEVQISHIPPDPNRWFNWEQQLENLPGPLPVVNNPPVIGSTIPAAVTISFIPPPPSPYFDWAQPLGQIPPPYPVTTTPPFVGGARMPKEVQISYIPPDPNRWFNWEQQLENLPGPLPVVNNPPFMGGARLPKEVQFGWIPPPPSPNIGNEQPLQPKTVTPPRPNLDIFVGPVTTPQSVLISWIAPQPVIQQQIVYPQPSVVAYVPPPPSLSGLLGSWGIPPALYIGNDAPYQPPYVTPPQASLDVFGGGPKVPPALASWAPPPQQVQVQLHLTPPSSVLDVFGGGPNQEPSILTWWIPAPDTPRPLRTVAAQPVVNNPPVIGSRIPGAVFNAWLPPDPRYQSTILLPAAGTPPPLPPPTKTPDISAQLLWWRDYPTPLMPPTSPFVIIGGLIVPHETILASVTITTQSALTLIKLMGASTNVTFMGASTEVKLKGTSTGVVTIGSNTKLTT